MAEYPHTVDDAVETDRDIEYYENLPLDEVNRQLDNYGIDAEKTISEVLKLVDISRQQERAKRDR